MIIAGAVIVAAVGALVGYAVWQGKAPAPSPEAQEVIRPTPSGAPVKEPASRLGQTYEAALKAFVGFRFQFANCSGTPGSFTVKQGSKFMLDNRDNEAHVFAVGTQSYEVGPYGFAVASASKAGRYQITCDGGGAAEVLIQP